MEVSNDGKIEKTKASKAKKVGATAVPTTDEISASADAANDLPLGSAEQTPKSANIRKKESVKAAKKLASTGLGQATSMAKKVNAWGRSLGTYSVGTLFIGGGLGLSVGQLIPGLIVGYGLGFILDRVLGNEK